MRLERHPTLPLCAIDTALSTARECAQGARALDDDDPWSYFSSGSVECFTSRYDDAIGWYRRAILWPSSVRSRE
jgi:hypothetical protein